MGWDDTGLGLWELEVGWSQIVGLQMSKFITGTPFSNKQVHYIATFFLTVRKPMKFDILYLARPTVLLSDIMVIILFTQMASDRSRTFTLPQKCVRYAKKT